MDRKIIKIAMMLLLSAQICFGATINVPGDSATIQAGINGTLDGDTVLVAGGVYDEALQFLGKQIVLISENGAENTRISQAMNSAAGDTLNPKVAGFSIYRITCIGQSNPLIQDCIVSTGEAYVNGSYIAGNSNPVFYQCLFTEN
jgi:hypothetical protein